MTYDPWRVHWNRRLELAFIGGLTVTALSLTSCSDDAPALDAGTDSSLADEAIAEVDQAIELGCKGLRDMSETYPNASRRVFDAALEDGWSFTYAVETRWLPVTAARGSSVLVTIATPTPGSPDLSESS